VKNLLWCIDEGCFIGNCFQKDVGVVILWFSIRLEALVTHRLAVVPLRKNTLIIRNIVRVRGMLPLGDTYWPLWDALIYTLEFKEYSSIVVNTAGKERGGSMNAVIMKIGLVNSRERSVAQTRGFLRLRVIVFTVSYSRGKNAVWSCGVSRSVYISYSWSGAHGYMLRPRQTAKSRAWSRKPDGTRKACRDIRFF
jgi:hypothetical protein